MDYILSGDDSAHTCIFCEFPAQGPEHHREHLILAAGGSAFVIMNRFPYQNGHVMVVPRRHVADPGHLSQDEYRRTCELLRAATQALGAALAPHGFNIGMNLGRVAGAGIDQHCHYHIVPRFNGDTNFMPVLADVKVISEHLTKSYERLAPHFAGLGPL